MVVAVAAINFSLAGVQLLIEGGSYSRAAFIDFGPIPHGVVCKKTHHKRLVYDSCTTKNGYMLRKETDASVEQSLGFFYHASVPNEQAFTSSLWPRPVRTYMWLL